ncbi:MAG: diguanylate cyclase, partial [Desulfatibacillum sp.]|nr:diguanylate cyclase [Desulfatibacillum sp.]
NTDSISIGNHTDFLLDSSCQLGISDILKNQTQNAFQPHEAKAFTFGLGKDVLWLRLKIINQSGQTLILAVDRPFPHVDLYLPDINQPDAYRVVRSGYMATEQDMTAQVPDYTVNYRYSVFRLPENMPENQYIFLRVQPFSSSSHSSLSFMGFIEEQNSFIKRTWLEIAFFSVIAGMLLSLFVYNLFLSLLLRDKVYYAYIGYVAFILFYTLLRSGLSTAIGLPELNKYAIHAVAIAFCFSIIFSQLFLQSREHCPLLHRVLTGCIIACLLVLSAMFLDYPRMGNTLMHFMGIFGAFIAVVTGFRRLGQGYLPARYYLAGWLFLALGSLTVALQGFGVFPANFFTTNTVAITCAMEAVILSLALGARIDALQKDKKVLQIQEKRLIELSIRDELTGLFNKRWFSSKIYSEIEACKSVGQPLSLIVIDIDHFKNLNDAYGHAMGDRVLNQLGKIIGVNVRDQDTPCRYGGEEFVIILPLIDLKKALQVAERLRKIFAGFMFKTYSGEKIKATISLGVAELSPSDDAASLFEKADQALYQAKKNGRNKVVSGN